MKKNDTEKDGKRKAGKTRIKRKKAPQKKNKPKRTQSEILRLTRSICTEYIGGAFTIEGVCNLYGVPYHTFYNWVNPGRPGYSAEAQALYKKAKLDCATHYDVHLINKSKQSLLKKVGYEDVEEISQRNKYDKSGNVVGKEVKKTTKTLVPTDTAIIFALTNKDPENFKNSHNIKQEIEVTVKDKWESATIEEMQAEENRLKKIIDAAKTRK